MCGRVSQDDAGNAVGGRSSRSVRETLAQSGTGSWGDLGPKSGIFSIHAGPVKGETAALCSLCCDEALQCGINLQHSVASDVLMPASMFMCGKTPLSEMHSPPKPGERL